MAESFGDHLQPEIEAAGKLVSRLTTAIGKVLVGQDRVVDRLINALISEQPR
jgi:hypothetical protein